MGGLRATRLAAIVVAGLLAVPIALEEIGIPSSALGLGAPPAGAASPPASVRSIQHVVVLMLENHAYDTYFGTYCTRLGPYCAYPADGLPARTCVPLDPTNASAGCVKPFAFTSANDSLSAILWHNWYSSHSAYDNGTNANFYLAETSGLTPFGHYDGTTAPLYWDLAEEYGLGDQFFSPALSYSLPNHWYLVAAQSPSQIDVNPVGPGPPNLPIPAPAMSYLNQSNHTPSAEDLLSARGVSWKMYDYALPSYATAIRTPTGAGVASAYDFWNPEGAKAESYTAAFTSHFVNRSSIFPDARSGRLPSVSWVIPDFTYSDHPPSSVSDSEYFTARLVDALESSPEWNSTALFITWDEYGGFYDHVVPPTVDSNGWGFRVPLLVVSPYAREGYVSHVNESFPSILHFIEDRFNLGCLTAEDCNATLPLDYFDFNSTARAPIIFPTNVSRMHYPLPLQNGPKMELWGPLDDPAFDPAIFDGTTNATDAQFLWPGD
ncbi:MAG TPA: alkaline phosphatase family protein [Thermoplasmata archaeon]|nr:alkaline phosphatase family protein [Thermoplasmata archaeon]